MFTQLHIENFKCLQNQRVPLSPLTLLTGFNSAGKSTTIQSLLLGSQLARQSHNLTAVPLNGELVKLGSTGDVLCQAAIERIIRFNYATSQATATLALDASSRGSTSLAIQSTSSLGNNSDILNLLNNIIFISATRIGTLDVFPIPESVKPAFADVGDYGQYAPWWFDQHADNDIEAAKQHPEEPAQTLRRQFTAWANQLFPGSEANTVNIERTPLVRLEMRKSKQEQWKRPANIGYGLTYAFPILIAGLLAKRGQILVIDSPEAHLHPLGQSKIGYFLGVIAAAGVQVIIETHSDHVLNGVRLAVAKKTIKPDDVTIHFFNSQQQNNQLTTQLTSPQINDKGDLSEWPEGFFDQSDKDLAALNGWG